MVSSIHEHRMAFRAESADCQTADPTVDVWFLPLRVFSLLAGKKEMRVNTCLTVACISRD